MKNISNLIKNKYKEKFNLILGFDLGYVLKKSFWTVTNQVITLIFGLLLTIFLTKNLTKEVFGEYQLMLSIMGLVSMVSLPGLNTSVSISVAKGFEKSYIDGVKYSLKWSLLSLLIFCLIAMYYFYSKSNNFAIVMLFCGIFFLPIYGLNFWTSYLNGRTNYKKIAIYHTIQSVVLNTLLIICVFLFPDNIIVLCFFYLLICSLFNILWHRKILGGLRNNQSDNDCVSYGKYLTLISFLSLVMNYFDKILIGVNDLQILAVYALGLKLFDILKDFGKSIHTIALPKFSKSVTNLSIKQILIVLLSGFTISVAVYIVSKPLIVYFYSDAYTETANLLRKLIFIYPLVFINPLFSYKMYAEKQKKSIWVIYIFVPLIAIVSSFTIFFFTNSFEYFVLTKIYMFNVLFFILSIYRFRGNNKVTTIKSA